MLGMRAKLMLAGVALALPLAAFGQNAVPVIPALTPVRSQHAAKHAPKQERHEISVTAEGQAQVGAPSLRAPQGARTHSAALGVDIAVKHGITAHAGVRSLQFAPLVGDCIAPAMAAAGPTCVGGTAQDRVQGGEIGAGFAANGVKLDLSVGHSRSAAGTLARPSALPRVLPAAGGADVAAPLWFRNSTSTSITARGEVKVAPGTSLDLGASVGHVQLLPGPDLPGGDSLDQTTLSFGIQHDGIRGAIVGHMLEPALPGAMLDRNQRWTGVDLGISVRLPWRGELNFGAQNVWTSGHAPLLFGPNAAPDQGRVPYVQYHQDL